MKEQRGSNMPLCRPMVQWVGPACLHAQTWPSASTCCLDLSEPGFRSRSRTLEKNSSQLPGQSPCVGDPDSALTYGVPGNPLLHGFYRLKDVYLVSRCHVDGYSGSQRLLERSIVSVESGRDLGSARRGLLAQHEARRRARKQVDVLDL